jgi:hypothetical protein
MINFEQQIKSQSNGGHVNTGSAATIARKADEFLKEAMELIEDAVRETGMVFGEKAAEFAARVKGHKFSAVEFHYEKPNGEQ